MSAAERFFVAEPEHNGSPHTGRRRFLKQLAAAGLAAAPNSPLMAQEMNLRGPSTVGGGEALAQTLARYAARLSYEQLPEDVIRIAKRTILDTFGCAFGGYSAGPTRIAIKLAGDVTARPAATVLIGGIATSPELAVFANGVMIRYLDFNDAFVSLTHGGGHPSDMLAALLTAAELKVRSGRDLLTATVLAYEVFCKIADVFDYLGNGIDHSTITGIAAVIGAGHLMGLTAEEMVHAIGITVGGNTATRQGRADALSNWKAFAAADACRKAMFSVQLAQNGMTGPGSVFEGSPYLHDPRLLDLVSRVRCLPSDEADKRENELNLCELEIVLKSGARKTVRVEYHRGHFKNPMTDAEMEEKFRLLAQKHLEADRVDTLLRLLWSIESVPQVSGIIAATRV